MLTTIGSVNRFVGLVAQVALMDLTIGLTETGWARILC
jgi:hypothetical protein